MEEYIKRKALIAEFKRLGLGKNSLIESLFADGVYAVIETFTAADVVERKRGEWVHDSIGFSDFWRCSACKEDWFFEYDPVAESTRVNFCPNCGADMRPQDDPNLIYVPQEEEVVHESL